jgi:hypothetical protein
MLNQLKSVADFVFQVVDNTFPAHLESEVVTMWIQHAGLEPAEAHRRIKELVLVLTDKSGQVLGVSTVVKTHVPQLQNYVYLYRCFIIPGFRAPALDTQMIVRTKNYLENVSKNETEKKCVGIMIVIQNETIKKNWRQGVWPGADMIYMGNTPEGHHLRIGYFKGARI